MFKSKLSKVIVSLLRRIAGVTRSGAKRLMRAMLQAMMAMGRRARLPVAGFVLPTVTMVLLVVILLTVAITLRSFDRANTARNVRVNQQVLAAATPALDRAKAKIQFMLWEDPQRPTGTPSDPELYARMANATGSATDLYSFGDEKRLVLRADLDGNGTADPAADPKAPLVDPVTDVENEAINTAWRYPVDTNNDGKFDTFTIYGIFFRSPKRSNVAGPTLGNFTRARKSVEARTPPNSAKSLNPECVQGGGTVASLVGDSGWYRIDGQLKKSFFVDTVNVPITASEASSLGSDYRALTGTPSTSALEYQQDQSRIPLSNNAVVYEDDLDISPGPLFNLNGRIFTNSNLLVTNLNGGNRTRFYQVSSPDSCFYEQENSKIVVGGNVVNGWAGNSGSTLPQQIYPVGVHLFKNASSLTGDRNAAMLGAAKTISDAAGAESTPNNSLDVLYNNAAYTARLSALVAAQMGPPLADGKPDPNPLPTDPFSVQNKPDTQTREQALEEYFKQMLRKVPFAETDLALPDPPITGTQDDLRPAKNTWIIPDDNQTNISVLPSLTEGKLETTTPTEDGSPLPEELLLGDRVIAGNNLPAKRWDGSKFTSDPDPIAGGKWNSTDSSGIPRTRSPQVTKLADVGATERSGFWEGAAAKIPKNPLDGEGGLRVITSAGVYERTYSFLPPPTWIDPFSGATKGGVLPAETYDDPTTGTATTSVEKYPVVWPDSMPMSPLGAGSKVYDNSAGGAWVNFPAALTAANAGIDPRTPQYAKGDLRMRATAVYHYKQGGGYNQKVTPIDLKTVKPFACVSSYYDPSNASTARNLSTLPAETDVSGDTALGNQGDQIGSNNGVVYGPPADRTQDPKSTPSAVPATLGLLGGSSPTDLERQANYVFPDGRFANEPLRNALLKEPGDRLLADRAAIDSTMCALEIIAATPKAVSSDIPHGAIQEVAFLNAREVKALDRDNETTPNVNEAFTLSSPLTDIGTAKPAKLTGYYNQPLEERQPLEIRATQIDLNLLRSNSIGGEPLLPYSGIIYASRDDALPDRSNRNSDESISARVSPTDSLLDPTRKPNGILLVNGRQLARIPSLPPTIANVVLEKGLTLASNLPVYIKGEFNLHTQQEFKAPSQAEFKTTADWDKFYTRQKDDLNKNFACRPNDPRLNGKCTTGDDWRPANILADAVTLLSTNYRFGFRNEGDFDLRNNAGAAAVLPRRQQGFFNNNFVTNGLSSGAFLANGNLKAQADPVTLTDAKYVTSTPKPLWSSYFNNFVTPVQRRGPFPEYVMEVCTKLPVSVCKEEDWYVNPVLGLTTDPPPPASKAILNSQYTAAAYPAGTTQIPPAPELQRFPRRVAFQRNSAAPFALAPLNAPKPLGINTAGNIIEGPGRTGTNALWFAAKNGTNVTYDATNPPYQLNTSTTAAATTDGSKVPLPALDAQSTLTPSIKGSQPLLMPVSQIQGVTTATAGQPRGTASVDTTGWIPVGVDTTFNMIVGAGDTPSRTLNATSGDFNGGLQNLPRFLEIWRQGTATAIPTNIQGSFIQLTRSAFNTAPYQPTLPTGYPSAAADGLKTVFAQSSTPTAAATPLAGTETLITTYNISGGQIPYFTPPTRNWGYDVGLLSQPPDLFTQKFTTPPSQRTPDEYFREVPRNDDWITTLMCGVLEADTTKKATETITTADCL
ncbi:hormogonium polysaccharide biosynthesis protein HpsA [Microcoleus sp. F8_C2]